MLFSLVCLLLLFQISGATVDALWIGYQPAVMQQYRYLMEKHPKYPDKLDPGITPDQAMIKGVDCSMYEYLVYKWAGVPGVQRVTAERMALGMGGWPGYAVEWDELEPFDILFFHLGSQVGKFIDHVGNKLTEDEFTHSGRSRNGPASILIRTPWVKKLFVKGWHITIGE